MTDATRGRSTAEKFENRTGIPLFIISRIKYQIRVAEVFAGVTLIPLMVGTFIAVVFKRDIVTAFLVFLGMAVLMFVFIETRQMYNTVNNIGYLDRREVIDKVRELEPNLAWWGVIGLLAGIVPGLALLTAYQSIKKVSSLHH